MTREETLEYVNNMWMYEDTKNALETLIPEFGKTGSDKVIDHEDKYKEALLEARTVLEPYLKYSNGKVREALDSIDKELKSFESDDERIRKLLVWQVHRNIEDETNDLAQSVYDGIKGHDPDLEESIEDWKRCLAWLERQKEPKEYLPKQKVYDIMNKLTDLSFSDRIPLECEEYIKIHEITSDVCSLLNYPIEQKEQKPSDLSEMMVHKEPYIAPVPTPMVAYEQKPDTRDADDLQLLGFIYDLLNEIEWKDNWAMSKDECLRRLNNYRPQKPPEWGEEDSDILRDVICATDILAKDFKKDNPHLAKTLRIAKEWLEALPERFTLAIKKEWDEFDEDCLKRAIWYVENPAPSVVKDTNLALWLKYLPGRFNLQPKQEWNEEDEKDIAHIIEILDDCYASGRHDLSKTDYENLVNKLKSLRPSQKSNKEQEDPEYYQHFDPDC